MITANDFTRADRLDVNGNPRYILHFLALTKPGDAPDGDISGKYAAALKRAHKLGGRKYHNKKYGGGIIFQSYSIDSLANDLNNALRGPVVWNELWDAMKATPAEWIETTNEMFFTMLEAVPPRKQDRNKFLVGEAHHHNDQGRAVYACFKNIGNRYFARYRTADQYEYA